MHYCQYTKPTIHAILDLGYFRISKKDLGYRFYRDQAETHFPPPDLTEYFNLKVMRQKQTPQMNKMRTTRRKV